MLTTPTQVPPAISQRVVLGTIPQVNAGFRLAKVVEDGVPPLVEGCGVVEDVAVVDVSPRFAAEVQIGVQKLRRGA